MIEEFLKETEIIGRVKAQGLYIEYAAWCKKHAYRRMTVEGFLRALRGMGFMRVIMRDGVYYERQEVQS